MVSRLTIGILVLTTGCGAAHVAERPMVSNSDTTEVRLLLAARFCDGTKDSALGEIVQNEGSKLEEAFRRRGIDVAHPVLDPTRAQVLAAAAPEQARRLIVVYVGHGQSADRKTGQLLTKEEALLAPPISLRSVLCLRDGPLVMDRLVEEFRDPTPSAMLIANACRSAHVDASRARIDLSVLSASTLEEGRAARHTPLGQALIDALTQDLDLDGDGYASDFELFDAVERRFARNFGEPDPKLRRQLKSPFTLFPSGRSLHTAEIPALRSAGERYPFAGRDHIRFAGRTDEELRAQAGIPNPDVLADVPCHEPVGQCFQYLPP